MLPTTRILQSVVRDRSKTIGFIGLGAMGREMAFNLLSKTFESLPADTNASFVVHDTMDQSVTRFLTSNSSVFPGRQILPASSPAGVASLAGTIVTMVPSSPEVKEVYQAEGGIIEGLQSLGNPSDTGNKTLCIDCTTLDPAVSSEVAEQVKRLGSSGSSSDAPAWDYIDAPVSGGVVGARAATLSFMVGSDAKTSFNDAEPTLLKMGARAIHCGKNTNGLIAKIANNLLLGISMLGVSEAMLLGTSHGLSPQILAHILNTSTGRCWASEINNPEPGALSGTKNSPPADRNYEGGFATRLQAKDLGLAMSAAKQQGVPVPLGQLTASIYNALGTNELYKDKDFSVAIEALKLALGREEFR